MSAAAEVVQLKAWVVLLDEWGREKSVAEVTDSAAVKPLRTKIQAAVHGVLEDHFDGADDDAAFQFHCTMRLSAGAEVTGTTTAPNAIHLKEDKDTA